MNIDEGVLEDSITEIELEITLMKDLKNYKALGLSGIEAEILKSLQGKIEK